MSTQPETCCQSCSGCCLADALDNAMAIHQLQMQVTSPACFSRGKYPAMRWIQKSLRAGNCCIAHVARTYAVSHQRIGATCSMQHTVLFLAAQAAFTVLCIAAHVRVQGCLLLAVSCSLCYDTLSQVAPVMVYYAEPVAQAMLLPLLMYKCMCR